MQEWIYRWLLLMGAGHILLGLLFIFVADSQLIEPYIRYLYDVFLLEQEQAEALNQVLKFILQLFGPTIASWGILFTLSIIQYRQRGNLLSRIMIGLSLLVWFVLDSLLSNLSGISLHLYINTAAIIALLVPFLLLQPIEDHA